MIRMLIWVDVPQRSRLLEGEIVGVEMCLKRGELVEMLRIRHHLVVHLYRGQHEAVMSEDRIDGVVGSDS
jgi:hypothetical protein